MAELRNMSKAEKKAALKAAKAAHLASQKLKALAKEEEAKKAAEAEKAEETKPQVTNKEEVAPKPAAEETTKVETKAEAKVEVKKEAQKAPEKPKQPKKQSIPTVIPEDASTDLKGQKNALSRAAALVGGAAGIPMGNPVSSMEGKAMLSYVMWDKYGKNEALQKQYPELYEDLMKSIDVVTLLALVDVRQELINRNEKGELNLVIDANQILPLQNMAGLLGIKLAPAKALPGKNDNQLQIDFKKSEVPTELTPEKKSDVIPDLNPNKIRTEEELKTALNYLISKDKNVADNIVNTVEWYRTYRGLTEENADKKLALDERTVTDWINEIFTLIQPSALLCGLGRAVYLYTSQTGSPCMAHAIMHHHMAKAGWSEEQIAEALRALISENFRYKLKTDNTLKPEEDKALQAITGILGEEYITKLFNDYNINTNGVNADQKASLEADRDVARKVLGTIRNNYFEKTGKEFSLDDLRLTVGQIINLYRDPADRLAEYCQDQLIAPKEGEYPPKATKVVADQYDSHTEPSEKKI